MFGVRILRITIPFFMGALANAEDGDVKGGSASLSGIVVIEPLQMTADDIAVCCYGELVSVLRRPFATEKGGELNRTTRRLEVFLYNLSTDVACGSGILLDLPFHPFSFPPSPMFLGASFHSCFMDGL